MYVAKDAGYCFGVRDAVHLAYDSAKTHGEVYMLGTIVHNERVIEETFQIDYVHPFGKKSKRTNKSINKSNRGMYSKNKGRGNKKESTSNSNKIEVSTINNSCLSKLKLNKILLS